jgi:hypothetical protein
MSFLVIKKKKAIKYARLFNTVQLVIAQSAVSLITRFKFIKKHCVSGCTGSLFFDNVFSTKQINLYKMGIHLDSLFKVSAVSLYYKLINVVLFVFDKFSVTLIIKKNTEFTWSSMYTTVSKFRRNYVGSFKFFWYSLTLVSFIFFII